MQLFTSSTFVPVRACNWACMIISSEPFVGGLLPPWLPSLSSSIQLFFPRGLTSCKHTHTQAHVVVYISRKAEAWLLSPPPPPKGNEPAENAQRWGYWCTTDTERRIRSKCEKSQLYLWHRFFAVSCSLLQGAVYLYDHFQLPYPAFERRRPLHAANLGDSNSLLHGISVPGRGLLLLLLQSLPLSMGFPRVPLMT